MHTRIEEGDGGRLQEGGEREREEGGMGGRERITGQDRGKYSFIVFPDRGSLL